MLINVSLKGVYSFVECAGQVLDKPVVPTITHDSMRRKHLMNHSAARCMGGTLTGAVSPGS